MTITSNWAPTFRPMKRFPILIGFIAMCCQAQAGDFFIHDGDKVVFLGDSITQQEYYTNYIETYALSRHPSWKLSFRNVGIGGDTSWLRQRQHTNENQLFAADPEDQLKIAAPAIRFGLNRDVLPLRPTIVTVDFGMNDFGYQAFRPDILRAYVQSETEISRVLIGAGIKPVFLTTQPIEEKAVDPDQDVRNVALKKFADALRVVAERANVPFVNQFDPYMAAMLRSHSATIGGGGDSVHPGPPGHTIMAWAILKGLGATSLVSTAIVDSQSPAVGAVQACHISNLKIDRGNISFDRLDEALPMPLDSKAKSILDLIPITHDLNDYELTITGLPPGKYSVSIDGDLVATVSSSDLERGWNLAYTAGPISKQAGELLEMVTKKNSLYMERWRNVQLFEVPEWLATDSKVEARRNAELERLDGEIATSEQKIDQARQPKSRHFVVTPEAASAD
jgi:lysophospholipase L1-like esterase